MPGKSPRPRICCSCWQDSEIRESHREHDSRVQDAYCLRCMPQVHGAVRGVLAHVAVGARDRSRLGDG